MWWAWVIGVVLFVVLFFVSANRGKYKGRHRKPGIPRYGPGGSNGEHRDD